MAKPVVSIVKVEDVYRSLRESLILCDGLGGFKPGDRILIKPNIVSWDFDLPFPPFGVVTTSAVMAALVRILAEEGFRDITIGEGPLPQLSPKGRDIYRALGYEKLAERYGVKLVDFNEEEFVTVDYGDGFRFNIARHALEADKIINVPVLKTHNQAKVSLGIKNLKGCLDQISKQFCHGEGPADLHRTFPRIIEKLPVALTVIDGIFVLEKGPAPTGKAYRKDLLIASKDPFACDLVGTLILGYDPGEVEYLVSYARRRGYSLAISDYDLAGEKLERHRQFINYDWEWTEENTGPKGFARQGITGLAVRKYDDTLCTGCSVQYNPMLILLSSAYKGKPFPNLEVVTGKKQLASPGFDHSVLFGKCAVHLNKDNPHINHAVKIPGCPPKIETFIEKMAEIGIDCDLREYVRFRHYLFNRYKKEEGFDLGFWTVS
ncbi:MAG TPA: DUF362 domain-containing protein [Clostridia bacterium]|nr:DUF362 domain-containing protein [Clostridia bacterium]